jgi:hypothetical protein
MKLYTIDRLFFDEDDQKELSSWLHGVFSQRFENNFIKMVYESCDMGHIIDHIEFTEWHLVIPRTQEAFDMIAERWHEALEKTFPARCKYCSDKEEYNRILQENYKLYDEEKTASLLNDSFISEVFQKGAKYFEVKEKTLQDTEHLFVFSDWQRMRVDEYMPTVCMATIVDLKQKEEFFKYFADSDITEFDVELLADTCKIKKCECIDRQ